MSKEAKKGKVIPKKLKIKDAFKGDAGRGIVRVDPDIVAELNLRHEDVIEIKSIITNKKTAALLYSGRREDQGKGIIRLDTPLRRNLNASLNDLVEIRKIEASLCIWVTFAGLEEAVILKNSHALAKKLENRVITKDDILSFYSLGRRFDLVVVDFKPKSETVKIHQNKKIIFSEKSFKEIKGKSTPSRRLALDEIILADKNLKNNPKKAKKHYKSALKRYGNEGNGDLFWSLALSYIYLGVKNHDIKYFFKAEEYFKKAKFFYKTQELAIDKNLFELDCLKSKIPLYEKNVVKNFTLPFSIKKKKFS